MAQTTTVPLRTTLRDAAHPITGSADDYDLLLELIGDAQVVLLGDDTSAVEPLDWRAGWGEGEPPETFPTGL